MEKTPVFIISGILESGKTSFIKDTIKSDDFYKENKTVVISCEEGEVEYDDDFKKKYNTAVYYFDEQEKFTLSEFEKIVGTEEPKRVVIEWNGMWNIDDSPFLKTLKILQFIYFINYATFPIYFTNMRQIMLDQVRISDVVVFINVNSQDDFDTLDGYSSSFKLTNSNAQFMAMDEDGLLQDAFKMELPYDVNADIIQIKDEDYGTWYIDSFDSQDTYEGKTVEMNVMVVMSNRLPRNTFIAGRLAMTCCSNDIQLYGHLAINNQGVRLKDRSWLHMIATMHYQYSEEYEQEECILTPISFEPIKAPKDPVLDLTK